MTFTVRFTREAEDDLVRLYQFLVDSNPAAAEQAIRSIQNAARILETFPGAFPRCFPNDDAFREMPIPFGNKGYLAMYEIEAPFVTIVAVRHQAEEGYHRV